jgi:hypothetical protein
MKVEQGYKSLVFQKLLLKLVQCPETLSKYEMKVLATHPVINKLLRAAKSSMYSNASFYIPIESLFSPESFSDASVPVIYEKYQANPDESLHCNDQKVSDASDEDMSEESTSSANDSEEPKLGHYTLKQRQAKINKYKSKVKKWNSRASHQNSNRRDKKAAHKVSEQRARFSKYSQEDDDFMSLISENNNSALTNTLADMSNASGVQNQSEFSVSSGKSLNDVVSEITGIY